MPLIKLKPLKTKKEFEAKTAPVPTDEEKKSLKAVRITMEMSDGSIFQAEGENANAIWHYQMECEQLANAAGTMPSYLGPGLTLITPQP